MYSGKTFSTVSHSTLIDKLMEYKVYKWTIMWIEHWLNCWSQSVVITLVSPVGGQSQVVYPKGANAV